MASDNAERIVRTLLEAPIDTGGYPDYIHPEKKTKIRQRSHPLGRNPAFPNAQVPQGSSAEHWEEYLASEQYQATMRRLTDFLRRAGHELPPGPRGFQTAMQAMFAAVMQAVEKEAPHKAELEKMAINLIFEQPEFRNLKQPYLDGEFKIDAKLETGDLSRAVASTDRPGRRPPPPPEEEEPRRGRRRRQQEEPQAPADPEAEAQAAQALQRFDDPEVAKRHVINAMIHGGAVSKNYAYQLIGQELGQFDPELVTLYGIAMAGSELGYFATPDSYAAQAARTPGLVGGSAEVTFEPTEADLTSGQPGGESGEFGQEEAPQEGRTVPVVRARGLIFPMLIQELAKGLLELVSYEGLPQDAEKAREVIDQTDLVDQESWAMIMGRGLWTRFVSALGGNEDEITMHLYNRIVQMPPEDFNKTMQTIQAGGPEASALVKRLAQDVRMDMEAQDRDEYSNGD